jgi:hypothetical protein
LTRLRKIGTSGDLDTLGQLGTFWRITRTTDISEDPLCSILNYPYIEIAQSYWFAVQSDGISVEHPDRQRSTIRLCEKNWFHGDGIATKYPIQKR